MRPVLYRLYHDILENEYFFYREPCIQDMIKILKKEGYIIKSNKIIKDCFGLVNIEWSIRSEFTVKKLKVQD